MITMLKHLAKWFPFIKTIYIFFRKAVSKNRTVEQRFEDIYKNNCWGGVASASGRGSDIDQAEILIKELPMLFEYLNISSILDIPCGDFNWMKNLDLTKYQYIGADIVKDIIGNNKQIYEKENVIFLHLNLIESPLPKVDLILTRDCLVHFSFGDIFMALNNIIRSESTYLLTTTFTERNFNHDIITGDWHPINLCIKPFLLPKPLEKINEKCTEKNMSYNDKSLALWRISDIAESLRNHPNFISTAGKKKNGVSNYLKKYPDLYVQPNRD